MTIRTGSVGQGASEGTMLRDCKLSLFTLRKISAYLL